MEPLEEILRSVSAGLPPRPRVAQIHGYPFTDSIGDPALRIVVVLDEEFGREGPEWSQLKPIQQAIDRALRERGITDFPYIRFITTTEFAAEHAVR